MVRYLTVDKFAAESGYTEDAVRAKIKAGVWLQGVVWFRAPDGRVLISTEGYESWVLGGQLSQAIPAAASARRPRRAY